MVFMLVASALCALFVRGLVFAFVGLDRDGECDIIFGTLVASLSGGVLVFYGLWHFS
jgi:hypothetical protein